MVSHLQEYNKSPLDLILKFPQIFNIFVSFQVALTSTPVKYRLLLLVKVLLIDNRLRHTLKSEKELAETYYKESKLSVTELGKGNSTGCRKW